MSAGDGIGISSAVQSTAVYQISPNVQAETPRPISSQARRSRGRADASHAQIQNAAATTRTTSWAKRLNSGPASSGEPIARCASQSASHTATPTPSTRRTARPRPPLFTVG
jgi:hypothetical protein